MTEEESLLLGNLTKNVRLLFDEFAQNENYTKKLEEEITHLKNEIELLKKEKDELNRKNEQMRLANQLLSGTDDNKEAKQKINKLIREIDKCIALLNQ